MTFTLDPEQIEQLNQWFKTRETMYEGCVRDDLQHEEIDLSDYENW